MKKYNDTISFIIPTLNEEKILERTLLSLKKLTICNFEIIVSDGGSTDATLRIARRYAAKVVENATGERQTIALGRNLGASKAAGNYYVFLDADVIIKDIDVFVDRALRDFDIDKKLVALAPYIKVLPEYKTFADQFFFFWVNVMYLVLNNFLHVGAAAGEFQMIRSEVFKKLGGFNERFVAGEDYDLFERLSKVGKTRVNKKLFVYHTSRRAHSIGWPRLIFLWTANALGNKLFRRSHSKEWTVIR